MVNESEKASPKSTPFKKKHPINTRNLGSDIKQFIFYIDSLADTFPLSMAAINGAKKRAVTTLEQYKAQEEEVDGQKILRFKLRLDEIREFSRTIKKLEKASLALTLVIRSFFVSLISQYDAFLGKIIGTLFILKPELLNISERQISFAELLEFGSIEAARDHIIEKEVETVLRKSHSEQFDWLESKFKLELRKGLESWPSFVELTERRNLFVHTSGVVSQQYIDVCNKHEVDHKESISRGVELHATRDYFKHAYETIYEIAAKLMHVLWRKALPHDRDSADCNLIEISYELIVEKRFDLARKLLDFSQHTIKKYASEQNELILLVNQAQAYKLLGNNVMTRKIVQSKDWSAKNDEFKLAEAVLLDDFMTAVAIMKRIGANGKPGKDAYRDWPLFTNFRKSEQFLRTFEEVFCEPFHETPPATESDMTRQLAELKKIIAESEFPSLVPPIDEASGPPAEPPSSETN